jgi:thiol:disulfide interchange protein DsbD
MYRLRRIGLILLTLFSFSVSAVDIKDILPPEQAFKLSATAHAADRVELEMLIAPGYHLYRDKFKFQSKTESIQLGPIDLPAGRVEHDSVFGDMSVYRDALKISVPLINPQQQKQLGLLVKYQGCADIGVCYPPQKVLLELNLPVAAQAPAAAQTADNGGGTLQSLGKRVKSLAPGMFADDLLPAEQAFQFFAEVRDARTLHVSWLPADGYYLYKNKLSLKLEGDTRSALSAVPLPAGESHRDPEFGQVEIYHHEVGADVTIVRAGNAAETITLSAKFQGCADRGVCYPPMLTTVSLDLPEVTAASAASASVAETAPKSDAAPVSEQDKIVDALQHEGLGITLASFFGFGLLLAFTPCVFPMIPILSGIIVGQGGNISTRKAFLLSLSYVLASALMYTLFGVLAALFGSNLQAAFQEPWVIGLFSALFVGLALSMFGFYNLELPQSLQTWLTRSSDSRRDGSYAGAAVMGALSALIVGPCVAAPLAAALIYIGQSGDVLLGGSALFAMGLGMGAPLLLLGASAGKLLPKSGAWLNNTKAAFGVIMLAVAVWMLSRIVADAVTQFLTALLLIMPAMYLRAIDPLPADAPGWRRFVKGAGFIMLVLGVLELIGLGAGNNRLQQPLQAWSAAAGTPAAEIGLNFAAVRGPAALETHLAQAAAQHKPVMLDFYADWCVSCKEMESYTFTDPEVRRRLADFSLLRADVTANGEDDKALLKRFNLIGPPAIIFFNGDGQEKSASRVIGYLDAADFLKTLQGL